MKRSVARRAVLSIVLGTLTVLAHAAQHSDWAPVGPDGGDARSFASDPNNPKHLYLGTVDSWIYQSEDGGATWKRLAKLGKADDLVLDNIVVDEADPKTLLVGAWVLSRPNGMLYVSHDSGATWQSVPDMEGQSIRALAQARSDAKVFIAGTLKGVYRSDDEGQHWKRISPEGSNEIHEIESIAIDPADTKTIYAGTWHLPWKTTDGGATWHNIKQGLIDDSDVFSIIIDPKMPAVVYLSACSGIYKSENGGELFHKQQGIPNTARRTRVLMQDPVNSSTVYAGTTEGLYQTTNAGGSWQRLTGPDVIINDVYVDPTNNKHVLLATDRGGVLLSDDGAANFKSANTGFSQRQVEALLVDAHNPQTVYAGVLNGKTYGGAFVSSDGGITWQQRSMGLEGRDVFTLAQSPDGSLYAGTNSGIFHWDGSAWQDSGKVVNTKEETKYVIQHKKRVQVTKTVTLPEVTLESRVTGLETSGSVWYAAASSGLYTSTNQGATWQGGPVNGQKDFLRVTSAGDWAYAAGRQFIFSSNDAGKTWQSVPFPEKLSSLRFLVAAADGSVWIGSREGIFYSENHAQSWTHMDRLPFVDVDGLSYDPPEGRIIATSAGSTLVMAIDPVKKDWKWWDIGWNVHALRSAGDRMIAASLYDGVLMQPKQASNEVAAGSK